MATKQREDMLVKARQCRLLSTKKERERERNACQDVEAQNTKRKEKMRIKEEIGKKNESETLENKINETEH